MTHTEKYNHLLVQKMKLDKFFSLFLDKFEKDMDPDKTDTPIWKLYKAKFKEYNKISQDLKSEEYWINKENHV
jgi:hypothetical protein